MFIYLSAKLRLTVSKNKELTVHPLVPIIMALGVISFLVGIIVFTRFGAKKINVVKFLNKEYALWRFVVTMIGTGIALIMVSVLIPKYIHYQPEQQQPTQPILSSNLKYELDAVLNSLNLTSDAMVNAMNRFQVEFQAASAKGEKNTMDLLTLELSFRIRTELQNQNYPDYQIEREIERILNIVKQSNKQSSK